MPGRRPRAQEPQTSDEEQRQPTEDQLRREQRQQAEDQLRLEKRKQPGIGFPAASKQKYLLIIRLNLAPPPDGLVAVRDGLLRLCYLLAECDNGTRRVDVPDDNGKPQSEPVNKFDFSATIGFGIGFFESLKIPEAIRPKKLYAMPDHRSLGDATSYSLRQTDMIIQLGSSEDFVNRRVFGNVLHLVMPPKPGEVPPTAEDIVSAVAGWATITDIHAGFQGSDRRNLQGFIDGTSNPPRLSPLFDEWVWTTEEDEGPALKDGTYMVFQKIKHDLDKWQALDLDTQQMWVGRSKGTGLLLGTLSKDKDEQLGQDLHSSDEAIRKRAIDEWERLLKIQSDPLTRFYNHTMSGELANSEIPDQCPAWSHVRKANPREEVDGAIKKHLIFRRGYSFEENGGDQQKRSGLLFVGFQKDIANSFEFIKKNWLGNQGFPVPLVRPFTELENDARHQGGLSSTAAQQTGREGLAGPSANGLNTANTFRALEPLGGGYYFCPPIPNRDPSQIGQQFFDFSAEQPDNNPPERLILTAEENLKVEENLKEDGVTTQEPAKVTTLGSYLIIARYNRDKWNGLSGDEQMNARLAALVLFPTREHGAVERALPNGEAQDDLEKRPDTDPLQGVRLVNTFHTRDFVNLGQVLGTAPLPNVLSLGAIENPEIRQQVEQQLVTQLLAAPGTTQKDPGIGWIAVVDQDRYDSFVERMDANGGPLRRLYDIEVIPLNNDQTTRHIYDFMTPVSWAK